MGVPVIGKILLDTNVYIDYLRASAYGEWVWGESRSFRFLSAIVLMELRLGADTPKRRRLINRIEAAFPSGRLLVPSATVFGRAAVSSLIS